jgi:hypothetical protein
MERIIEAWRNEAGAVQPVEGKVAGHRILLLGVLYAATIIVILMIVSRL